VQILAGKIGLNMASQMTVESLNEGDAAGKKARAFQTGAERVRSGQPTATDEVVLTIRDWLATGRIVPGQRLTEADLSRELGVSKGPVREAMQRLAAEGMVKLAPYKGYLIHRMSRSEVAGVFDVLEAIESLAARRAAENIAAGASPDQLLAAFDLFEEAHFELQHRPLTGHERTLNESIIALSGNTTIERITERIQFSMFSLQFRALQSLGVPKHLLDHVRKIVRAILAGDAKTAESASRQHLRALCDHLLNLSDDWFEPEHR
jgi:DNA-binding GntR family transcriptional regulator